MFWAERNWTAIAQTIDLWKYLREKKQKTDIFQLLKYFKNSSFFIIWVTVSSIPKKPGKWFVGKGFIYIKTCLEVKQGHHLADISQNIFKNLFL